MQQDIIDSMVSVDFYFYSDKLDFTAIDQLMGIEATEKRTRDSFSIVEFAKDYWILSTKYEISEDIEIQLRKILVIISDKKEIINNICRQYDALCGFLIIVKDYDDVVPSIGYERDFIKFAADINADISMDFT